MPTPEIIAITDTGFIRPFAEHIVRIVQSSGTPGTDYFTPRSGELIPTVAEIEQRCLVAWPRSTNQPEWRRTWGLKRGELFVGHAELHGGKSFHEPHRASLGIGIELPHRKQGYGERLLRAAFDWATTAGLEWIDLVVFGHNKTAIRLYERLGFTQVGFVADRFRMGGRSLDEVQMTLKLRA
jgi:RimJ/RimL family protein N-acetyltransferase